MRNRFSYFILATVLAMVIAFAAIEYMTEYTKTGKCYSTNLILSAEEMRTRVIKNLLIAEMQSAARRNSGQIWQRNYLVSRNISSDELISFIESKSIIDLPKEAVHTAMSTKEIDSIDAKILSSKFSFVKQDTNLMAIMPIKSLAAMSTKGTEKDLTNQQRQEIELSAFDRAKGYGNHYFQFEWYMVFLDCCSPSLIKYPHSNKSPEWHANQMIKRISTGKSTIRANLIVSNCGEILHRSDDGETRFIF